MKSFMNEFKEFIARGNVMDMAVGIIIGGAFTSIVNSLVGDIITPLIATITGGGELAPDLVFFGMNIGNFLSQIVNFLIIALVVFCMIKAINTMRDKMDSLSHKGAAEPVEEPAPTCPFCLEEVKAGAKRCPHCGSELHA
ncbi:large conductance mechanosensitive channel protein MscL [Thermophilibacter immobilis]|jgi:large conductance mechanosensitive channel|uniref:Large-conductance mechanosensitive channel n=1 Tax=Thermophilibacter immobilis TaxID=2779519 RepID=A0A7S7M922_9ACTN|nr:large conductance mechanosensitive channel protein MscL [Thermophilibacter immobilis]QOY60959.1 large conductance mechanosensitive channel protein MscL [Thermophilibacter immobilis]